MAGFGPTCWSWNVLEDIETLNGFTRGLLDVFDSFFQFKGGVNTLFHVLVEPPFRLIRSTWSF